MPTVFERVTKLGLAHSNHILQMLGEEVKSELSYAEFIKIPEQQGDALFRVNLYPEEMTKVIDKIILQWLNPNNKFEREKRFRWWYNYKVNRV